MAAFFIGVFDHRRRQIRRNRVFRDRTHPLDAFNDDLVYRKFRFRRHHILDLTDELRHDIEHVLPRRGSLTPVQQVLLTLRFFATGTFQDVVGEMMGVHQSTACRTIRRVTEALLRRMPAEVRMPDSQREADDIKAKFYRMNPGFPNVIGCIDGTHIRIQAPTENEHEYVNRKHFHSINVQVICDADLIFINIIARWPGSVHDARILRESALFRAFESPRKPLNGVLLGDRAYMLRDWLMTPILHPATQRERNYNFAHSSTRTTVERSIGVAKRRWHCLHTGLRLEPARACQVITVCLMLHNRATRLRLDPPDSDDEEEDDDADEDDEDEHPDHEIDPRERARRNVGHAVRQRLMNEYF